MSLDYGYTCTEINNNIEQFKADIEAYLSNMLDDCCPMLRGEQKKDFIDEYANNIYKDFESSFENVRETNESMRSEADKQIDSAEERVTDAEQDIQGLTEQVEELERQLSEVESELYDIKTTKN